MNISYHPTPTLLAGRPPRLLNDSRSWTQQSGGMRLLARKPLPHGISTLDLVWPSYGKTRVISVDRILCLKDHRLFSQAYTSASDQTQIYIVDFSKTLWIDESVLGMLLLLRQHAGNDRSRIHLMHIKHKVRQVLEAININALFTTDTDAFAHDSYSQLQQEFDLVRPETTHH